MMLENISNEELIDILKKEKLEYRDNLNGIDIPFGCEIEFEGILHNSAERGLYNLKKYNKMLSKWKLVTDESLNDIKGNTRYKDNIYGGEIVSPILTNKKQDFQNLKEVCTMLKEKGANNTQYSAAHIHFDNELFKDNYIAVKNLLKLWAIYEDVIYRFSSNYDEHLRKYINDFARPMSRKYVNILKSKYIDNYDILINNLKIIKRTSGLSFAEFYKKDKDSFEIRTPNGTIDEIIWQNNINFFKHILEVSLDENKDWEFIDFLISDYNRSYYKLKNYENEKIDKAKRLGDFIFNEDVDKINFMKQYTKIK